MGMPDTETDQAIVAAVLAGDRERFGLLVSRYQGRLFNAMWRSTGSRQEAEDLAQAAFCRAYFALHSYRPEFRFSTWLFQIAFHLAINAHKRRGRLPLADPGDGEADPLDRLPDEPDAGPETLALRRAADRAVRRACQALTPETRLLVEMRYVQQLSYEEICEATGLPLGTVKSRLARARRRLAELLAAADPAAAAGPR